MAALITQGSCRCCFQLLCIVNVGFGIEIIAVSRNAEHLSGAGHTHDSRHHHIDDRLHLLFIHQVDVLALGLAVGSFYIRVQIHLELQAGTADQFAVIKLDEQFLEVNGIAWVEVVEDELQGFVGMAFQFHPVIENPVEQFAGGLFDLPDHDHHFLHADGGGCKVGTITGHQGSGKAQCHHNVFFNLLDLVFDVEDLSIGAMSLHVYIERDHKTAFHIHLVDHVADLFQHPLVGHHHLLAERTAHFEQTERRGPALGNGLLGATIVTQQFNGLKRRQNQ